ncbi:DUF423 domain-containing protein [Yunchengibacter salinarum]|uniref:DUF423 domain-containing protein n=1 Tax=Yunchengibacter salinarum TaxID=3133399 RepID=UPI0035B6091A
MRREQGGLLLAWAGITGLAGVIAAAAGSHLTPLNAAAARLYETALQIHLSHAAAVLAPALLAAIGPAASARAARLSAGLMLAGIWLFAGTLYGRSLMPDLAAMAGPLTPMGGGLIMAGWFMLAYAGVRLWLSPSAGSDAR